MSGFRQKVKRIYVTPHPRSPLWLYIISIGQHKSFIITGIDCFAECRKHSTKSRKHSTNSMLSVTLGKEDSVNCTSTIASLLSVFCRTLVKVFTECHLVLVKENSSWCRQATVTKTLPNACRHDTRQWKLQWAPRQHLCREPQTDTL